MPAAFHHTDVNAPPKSSADTTKAWWQRTRSCTRVGSNQIEQYSSMLQRKVLTPNDLNTSHQSENRLVELGERYSSLWEPFADAHPQLTPAAR